ncbi:MAG TPA: M4 family metallopeptidase [Thermoanaerobaculales bacterium]|nr:M4 family metallopeptidase [Thermoanaerobaculales bacterium]HPA82217.1 M4 family metallopeptidase [Thermoanaerobaculales bacterium]HQL30724.1 M4 family metallopeptidase [Thermoanaerobaculales bacterium]HQN95392.1 M4 family metallopeptidase [Thermoanaerobaculales bacterium]
MQKQSFRGIALAVCFGVAVSAGAVDARSAREDAIEELERDGGGALRIELDRASGVPRLIRLAPGSLPLAGASTAERAHSFLARYGRAFGLDDAVRDLAPGRRFADRLGGEHQSFHQLHLGVPVFGAELRLHFSPAGELETVNGRVVPGISLASVVPAVTGDQAAATGAALVAKQSRRSGLLTTVRGPLVFRSGLVAGRPAGDYLVWEVEVGNGADVRELLYVDAHDGDIVDQITGIEHIHRTIYHRNLGARVWDEGDPLPFSGIGDLEDGEVNGLINFAEDTYRLFENLSGGSFRSWNGHDAAMRSIYEDQNLSCPNAWWTGNYTGFCQSTAADDVVAHEWTHAYTDSTHDLIYQWQPGALNEAFSDIFGEIVDQINGAGNDDPHPLRGPLTCTGYVGSNSVRIAVQAPAAVAGEYLAGSADFNPPPPWSVLGTVQLVDDGVGIVADGCEPFVGFEPGGIAFVEFRYGACSYRDRVANAQEAGAAGVLVMNTINDVVYDMPGDGPQLEVPAAFISKSLGLAIRAAAAEGVVVELSFAIDDSVRWVVAEDTLWNGLRDMWHPNCAGDPGKVSDSQYYCSADDGGGVHTNSGVPNHAFALAVDGGTYNGHTVAGIGLTKAAHIWWRAMSVYQTQITDFTDHAQLAELSCRDLVGAPLTDLETGAPSLESVTGADCDQVAEAMLAVEMFDFPLQCAFDLVLDPDAPALPRYATELFAEDFDAAPGPEWTVSNQGVDPQDYIPRDWQWTADAPFGGDGGAMFATNDDFGGNCTTNDQSAVLRLVSPQLTMPGGGLPVLLIDHYVATEPAADGGNVKISVNGGPFELLPEEAFLFNPYNQALDGPPHNRNPIAGQPAFSGLNEGSFRGSWGQSQVNLARIVAPGDTFRLRFDFGVDGCTGWDGWYLDGVRVVLADSVLRGGHRLQP